MKTTRNKKGFTLLELIIVIMIVGILASVSFNSFQSTTMKAKLTQVHNSMGYVERGIKMAVLEKGWPTAENSAAIVAELNQKMIDEFGETAPAPAQFSDGLCGYAVEFNDGKFYIICTIRMSRTVIYLCEELIYSDGKREWVAFSNHPWAKYLGQPFEIVDF